MEAFDKYLKQFPHYTSKVFEDILPFLSIKEIDEGEYYLRIGRISKEIGFVEKGRCCMNISDKSCSEIPFNYATFG